MVMLTCEQHSVREWYAEVCKELMVRSSFDEEVAATEAAARKAAIEGLSGPSLLLYSWEQIESKDEHDLLRGFQSQFGLQHWPTVEGVLPETWHGTPDYKQNLGDAEDHICRSGKPAASTCKEGPKSPVGKKRRT